MSRFVWWTGWILVFVYELCAVNVDYLHLTNACHQLLGYPLGFYHTEIGLVVVRCTISRL